MTETAAPSQPEKQSKEPETSPSPAARQKGAAVPQKGANDENFPVGSVLIEKQLRPHVKAYYDFARAIDDVADDPNMAAKDRLAALDHMDEMLLDGKSDGSSNGDKAARLHQTLIERDIDFANASNLIVAFKQDCEKNRYRTWAELIGYCNNSASPVGRFLLELHGEDRALFRQSDALCNALQVINHLQDLKKDLQNLDRSYLPEVWLRAAGVTAESVLAEKSSSGLRAVIDKCLAATDELLSEADHLPGMMLSRRLAMETAVIVDIAHKLVEKLRRHDPIAMRVELSKPQYLSSMVSGAWRGLRPRSHS